MLQKSVQRHFNEGLAEGSKLVIALEREEQRREGMIASICEGCQTMLAGLVREGVSKADAMVLGKEYAKAMKTEMQAMTDISSSMTLHDIEQERAKTCHSMICHVRQAEGDCNTEWTQYTKAGADFIADVGAYLLQVGNRNSAETDMAHASEKGQTDQTLLEGMKKINQLGLASMVKKGEDPESARLIESDAMDRILAMDGKDELALAGLSQPQLARVTMTNVFHAGCLPSTGSCTDILAEYASVVLESANDGGAASSLLQAGVRPVVQLGMKLLGIPEFPEETKAERAAVVKAYLKKRGVQSD